MPNQPKTPGSTYRLDDDLKARIKARAVKDGVTETEVVRSALDEYLEPLDKV